MAENKQNTTPERRPDCVTEIRMGNTVLVVSGFFKKDTTDTAADKMMNKLMKKKQEAAPAPVPEPSKEELLLTEIRDLLREQKNNPSESGSHAQSLTPIKSRTFCCAYKSE